MIMVISMMTMMIMINLIETHIHFSRWRWQSVDLPTKLRILGKGSKKRGEKDGLLPYPYYTVFLEKYFFSEPE